MWKNTQWKKTMEHEGEAVLNLSLCLPTPGGEGRAARRMERYYQHLGQLWKDRWTSTLYPQAVAALGEARENSRPFQPWQAEVIHCICLDREDLSSLYVDAIERRGAHARPVTVRSAETWDGETGTPITLSSFHPRQPLWKRPMVAEVQHQTEQRLQRGESLFYEDAVARVAKHFSPRRFYLTEEGLALFYPMCSLGSPAEGIPVFFLPLPATLSQTAPEAS